MLSGGCCSTVGTSIIKGSGRLFKATNGAPRSAAQDEASGARLLALASRSIAAARPCTQDAAAMTNDLRKLQESPSQLDGCNWNYCSGSVLLESVGLPSSVLQVRPFIDALVTKTRREMLVLLSQAHSLLSPTKAASLLGVPEGEVSHVVEAAGWQQDMESGMFTTAVQPEADADLDGYQNLQQLAQYMVHLESN